MSRGSGEVERSVGEAMFVSLWLGAIGGMIGAAVVSAIHALGLETVVFGGLVAAIPGAGAGIAAGTPVGALASRWWGRVLAVAAGAASGAALAGLLSYFASGLGA
jgi:hypothetical protein